MSLRKIPSDFQTLLRACNKITSYKRAVEELVYNSLDAGSTSIAIRISIEENVIQVIDNGCGMNKNDFVLLGQKHTTSKFVDLTALKSAPNKYGFRGQSLASIIEVSQSIKLTSRREDSDDTWYKTFFKGKEQQILDTKQRPSKGTTVEIKGFIYNLNIQKKLINALTEISDIKHFLEQLSLVHSNTSLSLRDDTKNEIIFKIHKNRDIYQTLSSIYGIIKSDLQELKVEKNQYKVTAFIGKRDTEINPKQWIFLNGKIVRNGKLQSIINDNLSKALKLKFQKRISKSKNGLNDRDTELPNGAIPFYLIFVSCPYYDYDVSYTPKQSILEFKNWDQISKLLEKMVKFYIGEVNVNEMKQTIMKEGDDKDNRNEIRNEVKNIMNKILGSNPKRPAVSQMQNGIKGKLAKRKIKKKKNPKISLSKVIPPQTLASVIHKDIIGDKVNNIYDNGPHVVDMSQTPLVKEKLKTIELKNKFKLNTIIKRTDNEEKLRPDNNKKGKEGRLCQSIENINNDNKMPQTPIVKEKVKTIELKNKFELNTIIKRTDNEEKLRPDNIKKEKEGHLCQSFENINNDKKEKKVKPRIKTSKKVGTKEQKRIKNKSISSKKSKYIQKKIKTNKENKNNIVKDPLLRRFQEGTDSIKQRCNILSKKVKDLLSYKNNRKQKIVINEKIQYSNVFKDNKNVSVRKTIEEITLHDYVTRPHRYSPCSFDNRVWDGLKKKPYKSSYDLVRTILKTQQTMGHIGENVTQERLLSSMEIALPSSYSLCSDDVDHCSEIPLFPKLTYDSHINRFNHYNVRETVENKFNTHFITTQSKDNFVVPISTQNTRNKYKTNVRRIIGCKHKTLTEKKKSIFDVQYTGDFQGEKVAIDFSTRSNDYLVRNSSERFAKTNKESFINDREGSGHYVTYTFKEQNCHAPLSHKYKKNNETYTLDTLHIGPNNYNNQRHADSQENLDIHRSDQSYTRRSNSDILQPINTMDNVNVVFVSESPEGLMQGTSEINIHPLEICEIVHSRDIEIIEGSIRQKSDSLFNDEFYFNSSLLAKDAFMSAPRNSSEVNIKGIKKASHHFCNQETGDKINTECGGGKNINIENTRKSLPIYDSNKVCGGNFNIRNRLRFVPKGMSPIFENCQTRTVCDYSLYKDYFEKTLYDDFANNVQVTSEMLQPSVQNVKDLTTKEIQKADNKLKKDNASLIFNADALKQALVLGQVDEKFIAAQIKGRCYQTLEISQYLVLFDQHAVHERIRLENNLTDYLADDKWKSTTLDGFILKLSKENLLYLHNYKDKFSRFGLDWTILNDGEVSVNAIPKAILGKNPRQVEIVMKAVKNIITEEINAIKLQKGCVSLYPKSIMDLVFSEACRYAIKFGDTLSKNKCVDLLNQLSECKTPFQCAHGRPLMAVVMELKKDRRSYAIDVSKLSRLARP